MRKLVAASNLALVVAVIAAPGAMATVTDPMLRAVPGAEWLTYGGHSAPTTTRWSAPRSGSAE